MKNWKSISQGYPDIARNQSVSDPVLCLVANTIHVSKMVICEYHHDVGKFYVCSNENFEDVEEVFTDWDAEEENLAYVTHWMELPEPPLS